MDKEYVSCRFYELKSLILSLITLSYTIVKILAINFIKLIKMGANLFKILSIIVIKYMLKNFIQILILLTLVAIETTIFSCFSHKNSSSLPQFVNYLIDHVEDLIISSLWNPTTWLTKIL